VAIYRLLVNDDPDAPTRRRWFGLSLPSAPSVTERGAASGASTAVGVQRQPPGV
jgi:hypothetical protein